MEFSRDSEATDRCFYCRDFCGNDPPGELESEVMEGHSRVAHWVPALQRAVEVSAHVLCFYDADDTRIGCNEDFRALSYQVAVRFTCAP